MEIFLKSTAASFREAWKMIDRIMEVANQRKDSNISKTLAEDVVWVSFRVPHVIIRLLSVVPQL